MPVLRSGGVPTVGGVPGGGGAESNVLLRPLASEYRNRWIWFVGLGGLVVLIPPSDNSSPSRAFATDANGDLDQGAVEETTALAVGGAWPGAAADCDSSTALIAAAGGAEEPLLTVVTVPTAAAEGG